MQKTKLEHFDVQVITEMVGEENINEMLENFLPAARQFTEEFEVIWSNGREPVAMKKLVHRMKSSARFIGANRLADQLVIIEQSIVQSEDYLNHSDDIQALLLGEISALVQEICCYLSKGNVGERD